MAFIAVEEGLGNVQNALEKEGYSVVGLEPGDLKRASAIIISGMDINMLQREKISNKAPVINAAGQSARDIVEAVRERLN